MTDAEEFDGSAHLTDDEDEETLAAIDEGSAMRKTVE